MSTTSTTSTMDVTLTPHARDGSKPFSIDEPAWRRAVALVEATYRGNFFAGLDRTTTKFFVQALRQALEQGKAKGGDRPVLTALVTFLEGAGAGGTRLTRGYRRWDRL